MTFQFLVTLTDLAKVHRRADESSEVYMSNIQHAVNRWAAPLGIGVSTNDLTATPLSSGPECCLECRFFRNQATAAGSGECHRHVPDPRSAWPVIQQNEWCGEFGRRWNR